MNVDFADVRTVMSEMGYAMMGSGWRAVKTVRKKRLKWLSLLRCWKISTCQARGVLVNITAGFDLRLDEFETVGNTIRACLG